MKTQMAITVPTSNAGELAAFTIEFNKADFSDVLEHIEMLVKPSDVAIAEELGVWKIV